MRKWGIVALCVLVVALVAPWPLVARMRATKSRKPRIHIFPDMDNQARFNAQASHPLFADGRAARPLEPGTVAMGELREDAQFEEGKVNGRFVEKIPTEITEESIARGRERFNIYCATCHGKTGSGDGPVTVRAEELEEGLWVFPPTYHSSAVRGRNPGELFNSISRGVRTMPAYGPQISVSDRWAIVAYVRALQWSQNATVEDISPDMAPSLR